MGLFDGQLEHQKYRHNYLKTKILSSQVRI